MNPLIEILHQDFSPNRHEVAAIMALNKSLSGETQRISAEEIKCFLRQENLIFVIARDSKDRQIIGKASLYTYVLDDGTKKGIIEQVVVFDKHRGSGVATLIEQKLEEEARKKGLVFIDLTSSPKKVAANKFYLKQGYTRRKTNVYRKTLT